MDRTKFYNEVTVNGTKELDLLHHNLSKFEIKYDPIYYRVQESDTKGAYLISYKIYGTVRYWWVILLANNIQNPFTGISVGDILKLPDLLDIYDFYKQWRVR